MTTEPWHNCFIFEITKVSFIPLCRWCFVLMNFTTKIVITIVNNLINGWWIFSDACLRSCYVVNGENARDFFLHWNGTTFFLCRNHFNDSLMISRPNVLYLRRNWSFWPTWQLTCFRIRCVTTQHVASRIAHSCRQTKQFVQHYRATVRCTIYFTLIIIFQISWSWVIACWLISSHTFFSINIFSRYSQIL